MPIDPTIYARRWKTLAVLSLSLLIIGLDNTILNVALPSLQEHFDTSSSTLQWIVDSYLLVFAGLLLTMGTLGDRFGRKWALQAGLALFGGASLAVLFVDSADGLIVVRGVMGVGGALIMPATLSVLTNVFPREERGKAIGMWAGMASMGIGLGPLFGGVLLEWFDWRSVFLFNVPIGRSRSHPAPCSCPTAATPSPALRHAGHAALRRGAVSLVYAVIEAPERGWRRMWCSAASPPARCWPSRSSWELRRPADARPVVVPRPALRRGVGGHQPRLVLLFGGIFALTQFMQDARATPRWRPGRRWCRWRSAWCRRRREHRAGGPLRHRAHHRAGLLGLAACLASSLLWSVDMPYWPLGAYFFAIALFMGWIMVRPRAGSWRRCPRTAPASPRP